ncbi:MAG: bifunctional glycosyltransferase family 2/GtrA family protein [Desulfuromonadales bacterium]|jgi:glycosyltransferase involved in cell wall biosynthesis
MKIAVVIPAYNPETSLLPLVEALLDRGLRPIIVVNDGSVPSCRGIFDRLAELEHCHVVHHAANLGKGRALKTGFNYCCVHFPEALGVVTADADGQHLPDDVLRVAKDFMDHPASLVLGARALTKGTPLRSRLGNLATRHVFRLLVGGRITDTQSGLRCLPKGVVPELLRLEGERYEYEMNMLILASKKRINIREVGIETVYLENNRSSHFNPLVDSMKIYFLLLRFSFSSLLASSIDFLVFSALYLVNRNILLSLVMARLVSGGVNFVVNKNLVFHSHERAQLPLLKYFLLFVTLAGLSFFSIKAMAGFGMNVIAAKVIAETVLFFGSFTIQRDFIFAEPIPEPEG